MKTTGLSAQFAETGFVLVPQVLTREQVSRVRAVISEAYERLAASGSRRRYLLPSEILQLRDLWGVPFREPIVRTLEEILGRGYTMMPDLTAPRNNFGLPKSLHRDCDSEGRQPYLLAPDYRFVKCGVYLQDNDPEWGGGITLVPGHHRFPVKLPSTGLTFKLKTLYDRLGIKFAERWVDIKAGDFLAFDSRLPHQSSFPSRFSASDLTAGELPLPAERTKYVLYWDACATGSDVGFLQNSEKRARTEMFFCDYVRLKYPADFPEDFVRTAQQSGIRIGSLPTEHTTAWQQHYDSSFRTA